MTERATRLELDLPEDWRDAWTSEADVALDLHAPRVGAGGGADEARAALDEFPSEALPVPASVMADVLLARSGRAEHLTLVRHSRRLVAAASAGTIVLSVFVMGLRPDPPRPDPLRPIRGDVVLPVVHEATAALTRPGERLSGQSSEPRPVSSARESLQSTAVRGRLPRADSTAPAETRAGSRAIDPPAFGRSSSRAAGSFSGANKPPMTAPLIAAGRRGTAPVSPVDSPSASPAGDPIDILAERAPDPSPPSPTAASVAASPPPATPPPTDRQIIQGVLHDYQAALNRLDPQALQAVWPDVDTAAYTRAFSQIERQAVSFHECSVAIIGNGATARCQGRASFVPKVGPRDERADDRHWRIELRRADGDWRIVGVDAR